jgi:hypothetical protein
LVRKDRKGHMPQKDGEGKKKRRRNRHGDRIGNYQSLVNEIL